MCAFSLFNIAATCGCLQKHVSLGLFYRDIADFNVLLNSIKRPYECGNAVIELAINKSCLVEMTRDAYI